MDDILKEAERKMKVSLDHLHHEFAKVRTGRASVQIVEDLKVDYYGQPTPLNQAASLATPDPRTITIQPWDQSLLNVIEKAIQSSDLGFNPANDGKIIRLTVPPLTEERRKELGKVVRKYAEECKIAIRNVRREINEQFKQQEKNHELSEDDSRKGQEQLQKVTDRLVKEVDEVTQIKEKDLMEV
ncbi:MAG: ribosome recycling factor [Nitrospina sp.]|nr:ribosome recycling factor [Nitrospina sp.]